MPMNPATSYSWILVRQILIAKLPSFGIRGKLLALFASFLCNRTQFVSYIGAVSSLVSVTSIMIQGSVVGPQLFTMMINDLLKCVVTMHMVLYADDGKVVGKTSSLQDCELNQNDLDVIYDWSVINQLPLCQSKSQCLHIGH